MAEVLAFFIIGLLSVGLRRGCFLFVTDYGAICFTLDSAPAFMLLGLVWIYLRIGLPSLLNPCGCRYELVLPSIGEICEDVAIGVDCFPDERL